VQDLRRVFGERLRALRTAQRWSQEELAHRAAMHWTYISDLERGRQTPTLDLVNRLARALGLTLADLFAPFETRYTARRRKARAAPSTRTRS